MPNGEITFWIAIWGAVLSSIAIIWDVVKWINSGAKLRIKIKPNTYYPDSNKNDNETLTPSFHIEIVNIGTYPTTLISVSSEIKREKGNWINKSSSSTSITWEGDNIKWHQIEKFPFLLNPGEIWSGRIDQELLLKTKDNPMFKDCDLTLVVVASHKKNPINVTILKAKQDAVGRSVKPNSNSQIK